MKATFKKMSNGWRVATNERVDVDGGHGTITVSMRDGSEKQVKLTRHFSRAKAEDGSEIFIYEPVRDRDAARTARARAVFTAGRKPNGDARYDTRRELGVCDECVFNEDAGDGRGCARHRGNPHT